MIEHVIKIAPYMVLRTTSIGIYLMKSCFHTMTIHNSPAYIKATFRGLSINIASSSVWNDSSNDIKRELSLLYSTSCLKT